MRKQCIGVSTNQLQDTVGQLLTEHHQQNRLRWAQQHKVTDCNQMIFLDKTTVRLNSVKGLVWNFPGKKRLRSHHFFRQKFDAKFMCNIYKYGLLPTAQKQFGHEPTL